MAELLKERYHAWYSSEGGIYLWYYFSLQLSQIFRPPKSYNERIMRHSARYRSRLVATLTKERILEYLDWLKTDKKRCVQKVRRQVEKLDTSGRPIPGPDGKPLTEEAPQGRRQN